MAAAGAATAAGAASAAQSSVSPPHSSLVGTGMSGLTEHKEQSLTIAVI